MATSTVTLTVQKTALLPGGQLGPFTYVFTNAGAPDNVTTQAFAANTFAAVVIPAGSLGVIIQPPSGNAGVITLKGVTGDTGVQIPLTTPFPMLLTAAGIIAGFGLLCVNNTTVEFIWI
jgi:hypothetical protein